MRNFSIPELLRVPLEELCLNILVSIYVLVTLIMYIIRSIFQHSMDLRLKSKK